MAEMSDIPTDEVCGSTETIVKNDIVSGELSDIDYEFLLCVAYTENFEPVAYKCAGQWLVGYGQAYIGGKAVRPGDTISIARAKAEVCRHLRQDLIPKVNDCVKRPLTENQFLSCCLLSYNMGTRAFERSGFVKALNEGKSVEECFSKIKGSGGVRIRRWVDIALFTGAINPYDLQDLAAAGCYNFSYGELYYPNGVANLSPEKVDQFLTSSKNQLGDNKMVDII